MPGHEPCCGCGSDEISCARVSLFTNVTVWPTAIVTLPALTLVLASSAAFVLLARGATLAIAREPYLLTARAKGVAGQRIALRHALPNALLPVVTLFGVRAGHVFSGALGSLRGKFVLPVATVFIVERSSPLTASESGGQTARSQAAPSIVDSHRQILANESASLRGSVYASHSVPAASGVQCSRGPAGP